jgi:hypothetical protein
VDLRRAGIFVANAGALLLLVLLVLEPLPGNVYDYTSGDAPRAVIGTSRLVHYDAQNDTTLAVFGYCNHAPCGDAFAFRGDVTGELRSYGRRLMEAEDGAPPIRTPADVPLWRRAGVESRDDAGAVLVSPPMTLRPAMPVLAGYAIAVATLACGLALVARTPAGAVAAPIAGALAFALARDSMLLAVLAGVVVILVALVGVGIALARRRADHAWAVALAATAFVGVAWVCGRFTPLSGGEV